MSKYKCEDIDMTFFETLMDFNVYSVIVRLALATVLGGIIGLERGRHGRAAGLRTHILVCVGSAMTSLMGLFASDVLNNNGDIFRISAQVISGIGFLGVGMILVRKRAIVTGLTTAAGLWATSTIGIAIGFGFYIGAFVATILCVLAVTFFGFLERKSKTVTCLYMEITNIKATRKIITQLGNILGSDISVELTSPKSNISGHMGVMIMVNAPFVEEEKFLEIEAIDGVEFVIKEEITH